VRLCLVLFVVACHATPRTATFPAGNLHRTINTTSIEAQKHFNRGLAHAYGFNFDEAQFEFLTAVHEDPDCAMCHWGLAYCGGANINEREKYWPGSDEAAARAVKLAKDPLERAFASALVIRYRDGAKPYADVMRGLAEAHPDDADAAILYSEAVMLTYPLGAVWWPRGAPHANIVEARQALERVLARDANHIGAIHFYIHLMEVSREFRVALPYAEKLSTLAPGAGHLIHMASHLYLKVGRYADAEDINKQAIKADEALVRMMMPGSIYSGFTMHPHHFLWETRMWLGNHTGARETTHHMHRHVHSERDDMGYPATFEAFTAIRFGDWTSALAIPVPTKPLGAFAVHLARGFAFAAKKDLDEATKELALVSLDAAPEMWRPRLLPVAEVARAQLVGAIAFAAGDNDKAIAELQRAVELEDQLDNPMEPPLWIFPARQRLGAVLLAAGRARDAADVYRKDLARNPNNGWSLFGLASALDALKDSGAADAWKQFKAAWARSDVKLTASVVF
jgi:tetratricopeptide (TPR) repeat protein